MTRWLLRAGVIGPVVFVLGFVVIGLLRPDYDPGHHFISLLSLTDAGWQQIANFLVSGALIALGGIGMLWVLPSRAVAVLVALAGIGMVLAGIFVTDPALGYPPGTPPGMPTDATATGFIHDLTAIPVLIGLPVANVLLARSLAGTGGVWRLYSWLSAVGTIGFTVAAFTFIDLAGLLQRLAAVIALAWVARLSLALLRQLDEEPAPEV